MNKFVKKLTCGMLVAAMSITAMSGCGKEEAIDGTQIVISGENQELTLGAANFMLRSSQAQMQTYLESYGSSGEVWSTYGDTVKASTLDTIETMMVMKDYASEYGVEITEDERTRMQEAAAAFIEDNGEEVVATLGVSAADIETILELYTYQSKMYNPMIADVDTNVTDEEAAQTTISYLKMSFVETDDEGNTVELSDEEKETRKAAIQEGLDQMLAAEDVTALDLNEVAEGIDENLVASASISFSTNDPEGSTTVIDTAVKEAVLENLEDGAVVPSIVEGEDAYYAVRVELAYDEEATEEEKETIVSEREYNAYNDLVTQWKEEANYTVDEDLWASLEMSDSHLYYYKDEVEETTEE